MMTQENILAQPINWALLCKRTFLGAGIGFVLISAFLLAAPNGRPEWGELWFIRPLAVVTLAGATGGVCSYIMHHLSYRGGWRRALANTFSLLVYIIGLWMGTVLGLVGTMWH